MGKSRKSEEDLKTVLVTIRLSPSQTKSIDIVSKVIQAKRGLGAHKVTRTEAMIILFSLGLEEFNKTHIDLIEKSNDDEQIAS